MQILELQNDKLSIRVSTLGAELQSLYSKVTDTQYLWQPGAEMWDRHSMLLFPNPGRIASGRILVRGKPYPADMHGFAYKSEFTVLAADKDRIALQLADSPETRRTFPYAFRLQVEFSFKGERLIQTLRVVNDDDKTVYFCLGAHPGFYCPVDLSETASDYSLVFDIPQRANTLELEDNTRLLTGRKTPLLLDENELPLSEHFFDAGPRLLDGISAKSVTLRSGKTGRFVELGIEGFPYLCLWGMPTRMSFICIEPWCGTSDPADTDHVWEHKPGIQTAQVGGTFERTLTYRVG